MFACENSRKELSYILVLKPLFGQFVIVFLSMLDSYLAVIEQGLERRTADCNQRTTVMFRLPKQN